MLTCISFKCECSVVYTSLYIYSTIADKPRVIEDWLKRIFQFLGLYFDYTLQNGNKKLNTLCGIYTSVLSRPQESRALD